MKCPSDLHTLFKPLEEYISNINHKSNTNCLSIPVSVENHTNLYEDNDDSVQNAYFEVGTPIRVRWTKDKIEEFEWRPGWYVAEVQGGNLLEDRIDVVYVSEPESISTIEVVEFLDEGKLQLA